MAFLAGSRILEVTVLSAENLTVDRKPTNRSVFVEVRTESASCSATSPADGAGGNPSWGEAMTVEVPADARSITFEVKCKASSSSAMGAKSVGIARIALSDFLGGIVPESCLQFLSYRLRDWDGRRNGIINFSVRVKSSTAPDYRAAIPFPAKGTAVGGERRPCGFQMRAPLGDPKGSNGAVIGFPVGWK